MSPVPTEWVPRWLVCLMDPLVDTEDRTEIDRAMIGIVAENPAWWAAYTSGLTAAVMSTLNPDDPWRQPEIDGDYATLPPTGAPVGSLATFLDLVPRVGSEADGRDDPHLASVRKPLDRLGALLLAHSTDGREYAFQFLCDAIGNRRALDTETAEAFFRSTTRAVKFALHRRREFTGWEDMFAFFEGKRWIERASRVVNGEALDEGRMARLVLGARVEPGEYRHNVAEVKEHRTGHRDG